MIAEQCASIIRNRLRTPDQSLQLYPTREQRGAWESIPHGVRQAHIRRAEKRQGGDWPPLPATLFLEFVRQGNRKNYEQARFARREALCDLVLGECIEADGRFTDDIINGVWAVCEETYWGVPAHLGMQMAGQGLPDAAEPTVDLFAAETGALLAWTHYLLEQPLADVSPVIPRRIEDEVNHRILTPLLQRDDFRWMGFHGARVNNWNPWICSNWLTCVLLLERDETKRLNAVLKILRVLDNFLESYPTDGGCDEGPLYWGKAGGALFDCLELLYKSTDGHFNLYEHPLIQEIGRYLYRVHIADHYFVNFADAPATLTPPPAVMLGYGKRIGDKPLIQLGAWFAHRQRWTEKGVAGNIGRQLYALFHLSELSQTKPRQPLVRDTWFPEIQVMAARDRSGSKKGLYVAAKGGHNAESHNHNDVGNFVFFVDSKPVIVDAGVGTYSRETFSNQRYDIWTMQSAYHNVPAVNGMQQQAGDAFAASHVTYDADAHCAALSMDMSGAYPEKSGLKRWNRTVSIYREKALEIRDDYELDHPSEDVCVVLLTPCHVTAPSSGEVQLHERRLPENRRSGTAFLWYDAERLSCNLEPLQIEDEALTRVWGSEMKRMVFAVRNAEKAQLLKFQLRSALANQG